MAKNAARKLACIRRITPLLDAKGCCTLYHSQVRSVMEYCPLVWSCCPPSYLELLDSVQNRAQRLSYKMPVEDRHLHFQPLQHRRDVAALCVLYKVHRQCVPYLMSLRLEQRPVSTHGTRHSNNRGQELQIPFSRTELHQRSFQPKYSRLWNTMVQQTSLHNLPACKLSRLLYIDGGPTILDNNRCFNS
ncbi:uncharacterized protein LOC119568525 [Penaeus monodon]|uniref:uncharacterized protein LOC119568525 n=1 Tax=Penaeus monodon TaxID=6687 RepID=UPI0018A7D0C1|nr:uncharacterized protein LOC119568525 [Penaeus monodon]